LAQYALIGNPNIRRRDLIARVTGARKFSADILASDIGASNFVYLGIVTSPYPSAKIKSIDVSAAEAAGYATLTGNDLQTFNYYNPGRPFIPLSSEKVLFSGQPVAAVAAPSYNEVTDAISLVKVDYEPQPFVSDIEDALKPGAPQLYEGGNSVIGPTPMTTEFGDADAALSQADEVVTQRFDTSIMTHFELEPTALVAYWTNGQLYTWEKTSYAFGDQGGLAGYFGLPLSDITSRNSLGATSNAAAGGIFGNSTTTDFLIIAAAMSKKVGAAVKWVPSRYENSRATTNRWPTRGYLTFGGTKAGVLTAMKAELYFNMGARGGAIADGPDDIYHLYKAPNVHIDLYMGNTNAYGLAAYQRDVGESQVHFMVESTIDMLAQKLGIDPVTFRLNNMRDVNSAVDPVTTLKYSEISQPAVFNKTVSAFNWTSKYKGWGVPSLVSGTKRRGVGIGLMNGNKGAGFGPSSGQIKVSPDGSVTIYCGSCDQGAGTHTTAQIMGAELLGLTSLDNVTYISADTSTNTDCGVTAGSQGTIVSGFGQIAAFNDLKKQWAPVIAAKLAAGTNPNNLVWANNTVYDSTNPSNSMTFKAAAALLTQPLTGSGNGTGMIRFDLTRRVTGTKIVEVEVDTETADVRVVNFVGGMDLGRIIFATGANSQAEGGFTGLGIGQSLFEETVNDVNTGLNFSGRAMNPTMLDFKVPSIMQTPDSVTPVWYESNDPAGPFGAKGIGELCLITSAAAISNALSNALGGYRFTTIPIRKEDIVAALQWMKSQGKL